MKSFNRYIAIVGVVMVFTCASLLVLSVTTYVVHGAYQCVVNGYRC